MHCLGTCNAEGREVECMLSGHVEEMNTTKHNMVFFLFSVNILVRTSSVALKRKKKCTLV